MDNQFGFVPFGKDWLEQEANKLKESAPGFCQFVLDAEAQDFPGTWEDLLVPYILKLEAKIRSLCP